MALLFVRNFNFILKVTYQMYFFIYLLFKHSIILALKLYDEYFFLVQTTMICIYLFKNIYTLLWS
jgi:hypothetical protein